MLAADTEATLLFGELCSRSIASAHSHQALGPGRSADGALELVVLVTNKDLAGMPSMMPMIKVDTSLTPSPTPIMIGTGSGR